MPARPVPPLMSAAVLGLGLALAAPATLAPAPAAAQEQQEAATGPSAVVQDFQSTLLQAMKTDGFQARYDMLEQPVKDAFWLDVMIRTAVGRDWREASDAQQQALIDVFGDMTTAQYAARFHEYNGQEFRVLGTDEGPRGTTIVRTEITRKVKEPVQISYVLAERQGRWGVVDILAGKGVSELATKRSEYASILARQGVDGLIESLRIKSRELTDG
ncbi:putative toluene tolerance protein [Caenispirillum salinarum AK4]|uniref:Putative toluene tolerance protein n=1 Tax=Caenispirillum salinarum AK4 TaxID=1238182 RepID=K9H3L1_9PROT|nr:ABC transporter substrate-binding protein [Caenispirillum salinarum]EKV31619.1 putative toluene tolerance protein [Caenispirillum salinarum AK4]